MSLRPYQDVLLQSVRQLLMQFDTVMMQLATGGGKTRIFCEMVALAVAKKNPVWVVVPRNELLMQSSDQLAALGTAHGKISAKSKESRAFNVHVVSKDTLIRRIKADKIKNWPKVIIIDEAHLALDQQLFIRENAPASTKIIGVTATPEKLDGRGLNEMYQAITYGPSIKELVEMGYLTDMKYFCVPGFNIGDLKSADFSGTEIKNDVLEEVMRKRNIYGNVIAEYRANAHNKSTIVFCRSVKIAEETAQRFRDAGYNFESVDGTMTDKTRKAMIDGLRTGKLQGLTSCELITYGLDVPRVECVIMLRPTLSRTLYFQMIGRGLRPHEGKTHCIVLDHVGLIVEHGHPLEPYEWQFEGNDKRKRVKGESVATLKLCMECGLYYEGERCTNCGTARDAKPQKKYEEIDGRLIEIKGPIKLADRPPEEKREFQDKYSELSEQVKTAENDSAYDKAVKELLELAADAGQQAMSVYWSLSKDMKAVNVPLLHSIRRVLGYKNGWVFMQRKTIEGRLGR